MQTEHYKRAFEGHFARIMDYYSCLENLDKGFSKGLL